MQYGSKCFWIKKQIKPFHIHSNWQGFSMANVKRRHTIEQQREWASFTTLYNIPANNTWEGHCCFICFYPNLSSHWIIFHLPYFIIHFIDNSRTYTTCWSFNTEPLILVCLYLQNFVTLNQFGIFLKLV